MIDIKKLERNEEVLGRGIVFQEAYRQDLINRGGDPASVDELLSINEKRKKAQFSAESQKAEQNKVGQEVAKRKRSGEDASDILEELQKLSASAKESEAHTHELEELLRGKLMELPNALHHTVPIGGGEEDNQLVKEWGNKSSFGFSAKDHIELGEQLGILDFDRASKVAGARFTFLRRQGSQLERALAQFMIDTHVETSGYEEIIPPFIVNSHALEGTGQFPKFKEDVFHIDGSDFYLIPTAEVPVTNFYREEILNEADLPQKFVAYSPCFRSEAGSYGKDTKGLIRQHQFSKVELLKFCHPDNSYEELEEMLASAEKILQLLEIPYRVMSLCSKDIGFSAAKCYDIEVWLPGQNRYREISSCSNCEDFQARRANIRFKPEGKGKPQFVHTLNGSGLAVGRTLIAVLENYQQEDGSVAIPKVLQSYMHGQSKISNPL